MEAVDLQQEVRTLAEQLAKEPFCRKYALDKQSLAKVNLFIEQRETSLERVAPEQDAVKESFRRFKAIWCLFLMQLEQVAPLGPEQLNTLALVDYLGAREEEDEITMIGQLTLVPPPQPTADAPEAEDGGDKTVMGNIINFVDEPEDVALTLPEEPVAEAAPEEASPWDAQPMTPTDPISDPQTPAEEAVETSVPFFEHPPGEETPVVETDMAFNVDGEIDENLDWSIPLNENDGAPAKDADAVPTVAAAQEYFALAGYFQTQRMSDNPGIEPAHLARLEAQQICFAIKLEFQERLAAVVPVFWPKRKTSLVPLWDPKSPKGDFHPDLVAAWQSMTTGSEIWPSTERLPVLTFRSTLKMLAMTADAKNLRLTPLEAGLWLYLFGQDAAAGAVQLRNGLGLPVLDDGAVTEAFLRLCRVHRLKSFLINPSSAITETECEELRGHSKALFQFSHAWLKRST